MPQCIYCKRDKKMSREDYLPKSLGNFKGFETLLNKICEDCNGGLSQIDEEFARSSDIAYYRWILGIKGRKHHDKRSPFYSGSVGNDPITIVTTHPTHGFEMYCEVLFGAAREEILKAYTASQFLLEDSEGKLCTILITDDIKEPSDLERVIEKRGLEGCKFIDVSFSGENFERIERIGEIFREKIEPKGIICSGIKEDNKESINTYRLTRRYFRAIAKISFHYFLKHFAEYSGLEPEFDGIKNFIKEEDKEKGGKVENWVKRFDCSFLDELNISRRNISWTHFLMAERNISENIIIGRIQFFENVNKDPRYHFMVRIGEDPFRLLGHEAEAHQFIYYEKPVEDKSGFYHGEMRILPHVNRDFAKRFFWRY
jgi:hypothetical protein